MAGWGGAFARKARTRGRLLTYALDGTAASPSRAAPRPVTAIASGARPEEIAAGEKLYATYCARCHGGATVLPDLRRSAPAVYSTYEKILIDGALVERGMPRFEYLDKAAVAALRAYVLEERRKLAAAQ
jgi:quinohemoprotein ethanol dehydrogenase